jgi:phytoene dehydrogenase-like protein
MKKIKILGAGLSGLSAAINLAKAGYSVDIFDSNSDSGARFHGDLQ